MQVKRKKRNKKEHKRKEVLRRREGECKKANMYVQCILMFKAFKDVLM